MTYYVLMENNKIVHYRGSMESLKLDCELNGISFDEENVIEVEEEPVAFNGELHFKSDVSENDLIKEQMKEKRAQAYLIEVDPITAHIQRLRDEDEPDEQRISELIQERTEKVAEIKERFPYPEESEEVNGEA